MTTTSTVHGKIDEATGKLKQSVGEATGNEKMANAGAAEQIKGHVEQAWGSVKDAVKESHDRHEPERHDIREKLVSTAQNVKEKIQHAVSPEHKDI
jgi:uncharacterized protein YjbJ (UPF0337 family)